MFIRLSKEFTDRLPDICIGVVIAEGLDNKSAKCGIAKKLMQAVQSVSDSVGSVKDFAEFEPYRKAMKAFDINPSKYLCSVESVLTRIVKSREFPSISPVVDAGNYVSVKYKVPVGVHSVDSFNGEDIEIRLADEDDCRMFAAENPDETDALLCGEPVYAVGNSIRTRRWIWRQMPAGRVTEDSSSFVFPIDGFECNKEDVTLACNELAALLEEEFACSCRIGMLTASNSAVKITNLSESEQKIENTIKVMLKGVANSTPINEIREKLVLIEKEGRPLRVKLGLDPSAPDIHLGHSVVLRKIRQLQDLGHTAVIIIGDYTGRIGDPTGKSKVRNQLTEDEVLRNAETYKEQIFKIIDKEKTEIRFNSEWLAKLTFADVIELAAKCTVARMLERDDFNNRYTNHLPLFVHEFFYPLMQAYDSVAIKADIELGGTDQVFNILMGRNIQRDYGMDAQLTLFMPLLEGLDGIEKMSKSLGNYVGIDEPPSVIYEKVMKFPDDMIIKCYNLCTDVHPDDVAVIEKRLENGENPRDVKMELAFEITRLYCGDEDAVAARERFIRIYQKKKVSVDAIGLPFIRNADLPIGENLVNVLFGSGLYKSKSEIRRLFQQSAVTVNGKKVTNLNEITDLSNNDIIKVGKNKFFKLTVE